MKNLFILLTLVMSVSSFASEKKYYQCKTKKVPSGHKSIELLISKEKYKGTHISELSNKDRIKVNKILYKLYTKGDKVCSSWEGQKDLKEVALNIDDRETSKEIFNTNNEVYGFKNSTLTIE